MNKYENQVTNTGLTLAILLLTCVLMTSGCNTAHTTLHTPTPVSAIDPIITTNAPVSAKVQVVNFNVNVINTGSENVTKEQLQKNLEVLLANRIFGSLGGRHAFSEVSRAESSNPQSADYIVSGTYDFDFTSNRFFGAHLHYKGVVNVQVAEAKSGTIIFRKTYLEDLSDSAQNGNSAHIQWLENALIAEISADIRKAIFQKVGKA